jgi:DNA-binding NarL/FixJ family response regulator
MPLTMRPIRVLLVDDHAMFLAALHALLDHDERIEIVGETDNGAHALELEERLHPDVALVDLQLPEMDGFETTRRLHERRPGLRVVVVSGVSTDGVAKRATEAGADAFLFKGGLHDEIVDTILEASAQTRQTLH